MKKILIFCLAVVLCVAMFAGCQDSSGTVSASPSATTTPSASPSTSPAGSGDHASASPSGALNEIIDDAKMTANKEAKKIVIQSIQRVATETAIENSVSVFHIDSD